MSSVLDARLDFFSGDTQASAPYGAASCFFPLSVAILHRVL